jgi:hypothetical protein
MQWMLSRMLIGGVYTGMSLPAAWARFCAFTL